jgi:hypothetical protein
MLRAWVSAAGRQAVVRAIGDRPAPEVLNALQFFRDEVMQFAAEDLEPLLGANEPAIDACLTAMHREGRVRLAVPSLLLLALRAAEQTAGAPSQERASRWEAGRVAIDALRRILPGLTREALSTDEHRLVQLLCSGIEESLRATAAETGTKVEALVRYAVSGEDIEEVLEEDTGWEVYVPGAELLVEFAEARPLRGPYQSASKGFALSRTSRGDGADGTRSFPHGVRLERTSLRVRARRTECRKDRGPDDGSGARDRASDTRGRGAVAEELTRALRTRREARSSQVAHAGSPPGVRP